MSIEDKMMAPADSKLKTPPKRKIAVRIKGKIVTFENIEQYFKARESREKTTSMYDLLEQENNYGIKKPDYIP